MTAGAAMFLTLLPLAGVPVIFHLLMRRKRKDYVFSTRMFFHKIDPRMRSRRRIQELLLLLSRVLLIALVLLTLSRLWIDTVRDVFGLGEQQMVVLIIDNSGSMNTKMPDGNSTKLQTAKESAQVLLSHLDEDAKAAVLTLVDDPNVPVSRDIGDAIPRLAETIGRISATEASGRPAAALERALSILDAASTTGAGSVHVFTDLQSTEWGEGNIDKVVDAENVRVFFHRVPSAPITANVSLVAAQLSARRVLPRQPSTVFVELYSHGKDPVEVRLNSQDDQRKQTTGSVKVPADGRAVAEIVIQPESKGNHWVRIWIEGDGYANDNQTVLAYLCGSTAKVFLVGEDAADFARLPLALSPHGDGRVTSLVPELVGPGSLRERVAEALPAMVAMTWAEADRISRAASGQWLERYVNEGGNLLIVPPARRPMNAVRLPSWLDAGVSALVRPEKQVRFGVLSESSAFWDVLRLPGGRVRLVGALCSQYHPLVLPGDRRSLPLLGSGGQEVTLALLKRGNGRVFCSGIAFSSKWTVLTKMPEIVVVAQAMALGSGKETTDDRLSMVAGEKPASLPGRDNRIRIVSLVGDPMDWSGPRDQFPRFVRSGGYVMRIGERSYGLSVRGAVEEGAGRFIDEDRVPFMGGIEHEVVPLNDDADLKEMLAASRTGIQLYLPLLLLAMLTMMAEGALGTPHQYKLTRSATEKAGVGS